MLGKHVVHLGRCSEAHLVDAAQKGDEDAFELLLLSFPPIRRIVRSLVRFYDPADRASEELEAAARLGLVEAVRQFDSTRGVRFTTFSYNFVRGAMLKALYSNAQRRDWAAGRPPVKFAPFVVESEEGETPEAELARRDGDYDIESGYADVERKSSEQDVRDFVAQLPSNQQRIIHDVFWDGMSHAEAARRRGVSRPAVSRTLNRVYRRGERHLGACFEALAA
jgi:RNA polymerase sigma factor (sigma-70 family)